MWVAVCPGISKETRCVRTHLNHMQSACSYFLNSALSAILGGGTFSAQLPIIRCYVNNPPSSESVRPASEHDSRVPMPARPRSRFQLRV